MATADSGVLDDFLNAFRTQVDSGFGLISGDVSTVFGTLVIISTGLSAVLWTLDESQSVTPAFVRKVLSVGFFAWLIGSWQSLCTLVVEGFAALGLKAGSGLLTLTDFLSSPSKVVGDGFKVAFAIVAYIGSISQQGYGFGFFSHFDVILIAGLCAVGVIISFIILAVEIAVTIIEFHIVTLIAFVTLPFGVISQTAFLSERAMAYVVSIGVKLMALALIVSIGESVFTGYTVSTQPTASEECGLLLASVLMVMLALKAPAVAGGLVSGGPQLNSGAAFAATTALAATVGRVALASRSAATIGGSAPSPSVTDIVAKVRAATVAASAPSQRTWAMRSASQNRAPADQDEQPGADRSAAPSSGADDPATRSLKETGDAPKPKDAAEF